MPKLPIALSSFPQLRSNHFLYIDKTHHLKHLIDSGLTFFLSRPKGFGKSLLLSTLAAIFSGQTGLFKNLTAEKLVSKFSQKPHPVLNFDLAQINVQDYNYVENSFQTMLQDAAQKFELGLENLSTLTISTVIEKIYHKFGSPVISIDNYDQPIINCLNNSKLLKLLYYKLRLFYNAITSLNDYTYFTLITGCEKHNYSGIFSTIHNIYDV